MHILFLPSTHGFGHTTRLFPVAKEVTGRTTKDGRVVVSLAVSVTTTAILSADNAGGLIHLLPYPTSIAEPGLVQRTASTIDLVQSAALIDVLRSSAGDDAGDEWTRKLPWTQQLAKAVASSSLPPVDVIVADIPMLAHAVRQEIAVRQQSAVRLVALTNFSWASIYRWYEDEVHVRACSDVPDADVAGIATRFGALSKEWQQQYAQFDGCIHLPCAVPMPALDVLPWRRKLRGWTGRVAAVASLDREGRRSTVFGELVAADHRVMLVGLGGHSFPYDCVGRWSIPATWHVVVSSQMARFASRPVVESDRVTILDMDALSMSGVTFADVVAASDIFVTKPGYGSVSECVLSATRVMYVRRDSFQEQDYLLRGLVTHVPAVEVNADELVDGRIFEQADKLMDTQSPIVPAVCGNVEAADMIMEFAEEQRS